MASFTRLKKELETCAERLVKNSKNANDKTTPTDAALFSRHIIECKTDIMILESLLEEFDKIILKIENLSDTSDDPNITAKCEVLAYGSTSNPTGYIKIKHDSQEILLSVRSNKMILEEEISNTAKLNAPPPPAPNYLVQPPTPDSMMLPKIKYERFDGDKKKWILFWNRFKPIHTSKNFADVDKLNFLIGLLDGPAKRIFKSIDDYDELKRDSDSIVDSRKCFDKAESILKQLETHGEDVDQKSLQTRWEKYLIPPWLYEGCLMKLDSNDKLSSFRKEAEKFLSIKEKVGERTNESSTTTYCNVVKGENAKDKRKNRKSNDKKKDVKDDKDKKDPKCLFCGEKHYSRECQKYATVEERKKFLDEQKKCHRCFRKNHKTKDCNTKRKCYNCKESHNTVLCPDVTPKMKSAKTNVVTAESLPEPAKFDERDATSTLTAAATVERKEIVLPIIEAPVANPKIKSFSNAPLLMDSAKLINLETFNCDQPQIKRSKVYSLLVKFKNGETEVIRLHGIERITRKLTMALPAEFDEVKFKNVIPPILIGGEYFWRFFYAKKMASGYYLAKTKFGDIICGQGPAVTSTTVSTLSIQSKVLEAIDQLEKKVEFQWQYEAAGIFDDPQKSERQIVDEFFLKNFRINSDGKYIVRLPWNSDSPSLNDHKLLCYYRLKSLITSLKAKEKLHILFDAFNDHITRGFVEYVTPEMDKKCTLKHFMPYHIIEKDSATTPFRVVFDCSASMGPNDPSLNKNLYSGPPKMPDMVGMMARFRCYIVVVIADIAKAFMQIILDERDRDVFRFLVLVDPKKESCFIGTSC
uniref:Peptidase aspartic putative domain-containing protein n=1 Tax=Panagrolaimus superbus TaxID=310955 RepID=A0A914Y785_9BILA